MGLDQFAYKTKVKPSKEVDFNEEINDKELEELHYWRKHPNLHGWMEALYKKKGGTGEDFNGNTLVLTSEDLDDLAASIIDKELPQTSGFFFGSSQGTEEEDQDVLEFVKKAHKEIYKGYTVYYDSWW